MALVVAPQVVSDRRKHEKCGSKLQAFESALKGSPSTGLANRDICPALPDSSNGLPYILLPLLKLFSTDSLGGLTAICEKFRSSWQNTFTMPGHVDQFHKLVSPLLSDENAIRNDTVINSLFNGATNTFDLGRLQITLRRNNDECRMDCVAGLGTVDESEISLRDFVSSSTTPATGIGFAEDFASILFHVADCVEKLCGTNHADGSLRYKMQSCSLIFFNPFHNSSIDCQPWHLDLPVEDVFHAHASDPAWREDLIALVSLSPHCALDICQSLMGYEAWLGKHKDSSKDCLEYPSADVWWTNKSQRIQIPFGYLFLFPASLTHRGSKREYADYYNGDSTHLRFHMFLKSTHHQLTDPGYKKKYDQTTILEKIISPQ